MSNYYTLYDDGHIYNICEGSLQMFINSFRKMVEIKVNPKMEKIQIGVDSNIEGIEIFFNLDLELIILR